MTTNDFAEIESSLAVQLPENYRTLLSGPTCPVLGETGLFDDPSLIIARTLEQRSGYGGAPAWAKQFVYVGDQEDACPYALDCGSGRVVQTDHGNLAAEPLKLYRSIDELASELLAFTQQPVNKSSWWPFSK